MKTTIAIVFLLNVSCHAARYAGSIPITGEALVDGHGLFDARFPFEAFVDIVVELDDAQNANFHKFNLSLAEKVDITEDVFLASI